MNLSHNEARDLERIKQFESLCRGLVKGCESGLFVAEDYCELLGRTPVTTAHAIQLIKSVLADAKKMGITNVKVNQ